jgi:(p)ppGpp synthase/HD superfamily hydrolase
LEPLSPGVCAFGREWRNRSKYTISRGVTDSVEDNYATLAEIKQLFGDKVTEIVSLISEEIHTDHLFSGNRDYYFERIKSYPDEYVRRAVMKIKTADRYDNLIGISYTDLDKKKQQFKDEIEKYLRSFAREVGLEYLLDWGLQILNGELTPPDIHLELVLNINDELKPR